MKSHLFINGMLKKSGGHISFHTPGHKRVKGDITELDYSDNLSSPTGVIKAAEEDVAQILGADKSFLLTDGSSAGVHAMLYALSLAGVKRLALSPYSHASVLNGCKLCGITPVFAQVKVERGIPLQPTVSEVKLLLGGADALLLTSPDYYGNVPDLADMGALCKQAGKPMIVDGAHGSHLHFTDLHAGRYADMWVDGVHKSLPALTQGAVVSAKKDWVEFLREGVLIFRTSSPSYPIMGSVEYAVKYPRNERLEREAVALKKRVGAYENDDWSKLVIPFGEHCSLAQSYLQWHGVYAEFNDGNYLMFYLSPATKLSHLKRLERLLKGLPRGEISTQAEQLVGEGEEEEWLLLQDSVGRVCARECGLFPPCLPLLRKGERITADKVKKLQRANGVFGLNEGTIAVFTERE